MMSYKNNEAKKDNNVISSNKNYNLAINISENKSCFVIKFLEKIYRINKQKIVYVFSKIENKNKSLKNLTTAELKNYLIKYDMCDEFVLNNLAEI